MSDSFLSIMGDCEKCPGCDLSSFIVTAVGSRVMMNGNSRPYIRDTDVLFIVSDVAKHKEALPLLLMYMGVRLKNYRVISPSLGFPDSKPKIGNVKNCASLVSEYIGACNAKVVVSVGKLVSKMLAGEKATLPPTSFGRTLPIISGCETPVFILNDILPLCDPREADFHYGIISESANRLKAYLKDCLSNVQ